jgi:C1A family cysteine protease
MNAKLYPWIPDLPDMRDYVFADHFKKLGDLPSKKDLLELCSRVESQGHLGSCTGNALVGAMEILENKNKESFVELSRLFIYYNERCIEGNVYSDSGAFLRDGVKTLAVNGVCSEKIWPYRIANYSLQPSRQAYGDALKRRITKYVRLNSLEEMK